MSDDFNAARIAAIADGIEIPDWEAALKAARQEEMKRWARVISRHELKNKEGELYRLWGDKYERVCEIERLNAEDSRHRMEGKATDSWFITVNPPENVDIVSVWNDLGTYCKRALAKGTLLGYHLVVEQRSEDPASPHGWHVHALLRFDEELSRSNARDRMKSVFNKIWTDQQRKHKQYSKNWNVWLHLQEYHRKYIEGDKRDEKMAKVYADVEVRKRYGFPDFLQGGEIIFPSSDIENGLQTFSQDGSEGSSLR